jgi:outer membrane protein assembly factor BamB
LLFAIPFSFPIIGSGNAQAVVPASASTAGLIASPEPGWPQFRGPRRDGVSDERGLLKTWPSEGPKRLWSAEKLGRGYSSPIIVQDRIYLTGDVGDELHLFALDLDGRLLWTAKNGASWKADHPGTRAGVTYSAGHLFHMNAHGRVACFDAASGRERWAVDVLDRFGGKNITWGISENLLVDGRAVFVTAGGRDALLVAFDRDTGALLWKSAPLPDTEGDGSPDNAGYASPILVRFGERRLLVGTSLRHLYCADADTGALQWTRRFPTSYNVLSMMPVFTRGGIFMTAPLGKGGRFFHLQPPATAGGTIGARDGWSTTLDTVHGGGIALGGKIIASSYRGRNAWAALDAATGQVLYDTAEFVKGAPLLADGRIHALCEDGWMALLEAGEKAFTVHGRFRFAEAARRDAWAHPVIHQGRLYLRYHETLACFDIRAAQ